MKASQFHVSTLKEAPADAEVVSHRLMTRAGMIKKLAGGIYTYSQAGAMFGYMLLWTLPPDVADAVAAELAAPVGRADR